MSSSVLANLCIQDQCEYKTIGIIDMNCDLILGIDWLQQHNPSIDWESHQISFSCCNGNNPVQPSKSVATLKKGDAMGISHSSENSIHVAVLSVDDFFVQDQISTFGIINFIPDSIVLAASITNPASEIPIPAPGTLEYIKSKVPKKYHGFLNVFVDKEATTLPPHHNQDIRIEIEDGKAPPFSPIYSLTPMEKEALHTYISDNLAKGFIHPSTSSAASPILFVKKPNGSLCLCVDYHGLNAMTKHNRYPLPLVNELLDAVQGCSIFTKLDLKSAFNLLQVAAGDEWKTAFHTNEGLFEYLVMPFGLTNAPAAFQSFIQWVLHEYLDIICIVYLDDILIFSHTQEAHDAHVLLILHALDQHGLLASVDKCKFDKESLEYLGFILGKNGVTMHPSKLSTISNWPEPCSVKDVQHFLGLANFYQWFISHYSSIASPLYKLTHKDAPLPFKLTDDTHKAVASLKVAFQMAPILIHHNPSKPVFLFTNASNFAISGIPHQA